MNPRFIVLAFLAAIVAIGVAAAGTAPAPTVTSPTHAVGVPSNATVAEFHWTVTAGLSGPVTYFHALTADPLAQPSAIDNSTTDTSAMHLVPASGQWYFHVVATSGAERSATAHYGPISRNLTLEQRCAAAFQNSGGTDPPSDSGMAGCIAAAQNKFAPEAILGLFMAFLAKFGSATLKRG